MWSAFQLYSDSEKITFQILKDGKRISTSEFISGLKDSEEFRTFYNAVLCDVPYPAFFWENKPMHVDSLADEYEFCVVKGRTLNAIEADRDAFSQHFQTADDVVVFSNLGGDARLIVPCPIQDDSQYAHLGKFVRSSSKLQIDHFWKKVGDEIFSSISEKPKWLSTAGMGVSWLHVRIDSQPKYYRTVAYKKA